jgi:PAS domain S-box-containing protein
LGKNFLDNPTIAGFVMNVRDVTERKRAEQELYNLNQFCESIIDDANIWIDVLDTHANVVIWNKAAEKISGYSREEAAGHNKIWTWLYPDDSYRKEIVAKARAIIEKGEVIEGFETSIRCKDGERKIISWNSRNLLNETKEVIGSIAVGSDVSERRRAEEKLRESEEQLRAIFETAQDSIFIKDLSLRYIRVNPATKHLFGIPAAKLIGSSDEDIFGKEAARRIRKIDSRVLEGKIMEDEQARLIRGVSTVVHIIKTPLYDNKGKISGMCGIARDITERSKAEKELRDAYHKLKEAQQQLIQSGKMMAMGQLAAGISHEINQPLTGIKGFAQAVLTELDVNSPIREDIQKIVKQSDRIDRIISNVRLFAHKSKFKMEELDINKPIEDSLMLLSEQLRVHNIRLNKSLTPELPKIKADPNQLQQVFVNLITNARDAIDSLKSPGGGELLVKSSLSQDQKNIEVIFQDTGRGILKENLKNIFNPFFTTKSPYAGTGLGLSIVHRIIESHKGNIEVASKQGKGTMFRIILPAIKTREKIKINQDKKTRSNPAE